jgi:hypothetical protein
MPHPGAPASLLRPGGGGADLVGGQLFSVGRHRHQEFLALVKHQWDVVGIGHAVGIAGAERQDRISG